jgi:hypothetical protein
LPIFLYGYLLIELSPNQELRPFRKACSPISLDTARRFLDDDRLLFTSLLDRKEGFKPSFPKICFTRKCRTRGAPSESTYSHFDGWKIAWSPIAPSTPAIREGGYRRNR